MFLLKQEAGGQGERIALSSRPLVIGKKEDVDIRLTDSFVSGRHAQIEWDGNAGVVRIKDLNSRNGTLVDGQRVGEGLLHTGQVLQIGGVRFVLVQETGQDAQRGANEGEPQAGATARRDSPVAAARASASEEEMLRIESYKRSVDSILIDRLNRTKSVGEPKEALRARVEGHIDRILSEIPPERGLERAAIKKSLLADVLGFGPIEPFLEDESVTEVMVNSESSIYVERGGKIQQTSQTFRDRDHLINIIDRIVAPIGRRIDESSPMVDARLPDGSRVNAIIPPLAIDGPSVTIRKFSKKSFTVEDLISWGSISKPIADFLKICVHHRLNILISGGTGTGKTTLLNILSSFIPSDERIVTIEDSAELRLTQPHVVRLESRPANVEGKGRIGIRELVINSLRMRPDRIVVGECRGGEALDMVQAMSTGHDGSLTTAHANSPRDALRRVEIMCMMAGMDLPLRAIREQIASAVNLIVQISRFADGSRKITAVTEITGMEQDVVTLQDLFVYNHKGYDASGRIKGAHGATGNIPCWMDRLRDQEQEIDLSIFKPSGTGA